MSEFGGIREVSISGSDDRLCRFHVSLLRARNACRFACGIDLAGCFYTRRAPRTHTRESRMRFISRRSGSAARSRCIGNNSCGGRFKERITTKISKKIWPSLKCLPFKYYNAGQYCSSRRRGEIEKWLVKHKTLATPVESARFRSQQLFRSLKKKRREKKREEEKKK